MSSFICRICLDALQNKTAMSTTCGHVFCSECATHQFAQTRPVCPVCRRPQTFQQLIRLFPEYGNASEDAADMPTMPQPQPHNPEMRGPHVLPHPFPNPQPTPFTHPNPQYIPSAHIPPPTPPPPPAPTRTEDVSALRVSLNPTGFPWGRAGTAPTLDKDRSQLFLGIAAFRGGMHPCKIRPNCNPMTWVSYGGEEHQHRGEAYLLPFDRTTMEWVSASNGQIPRGRRPVEGGYERVGGQRLYHALATVEGVKVPGKTGAHINGANVPFGSREHHVRNYEVLCWRD